MSVRKGGFVFTLKVGDADRRLHVEVKGDTIRSRARLLVDAGLNVVGEEDMPDAYTSSHMLDTFEEIREELLVTWASKLQQHLKDL